MLDQVFRSHHVIARLRGGPLADVLDDLAAYLLQRGNARATVQEYVRAAGHLVHWLRASGIPVATLTEEIVRQFLDGHLPRCRCTVPFGSHPHSRVAMGHLLRVLREAGRIPPAPIPTATPVDLAIQVYDAHLRGARGATAQTCAEYTRYVREFLKGISGVGDQFSIGDIGPRQVMEFVAKRAKHCKPGTAKLVATALRSFLRFQQMQGRCTARLVDAVPTIPRWRLAQIPKTLTDEQLRALLTSFDRSTAIGRRDYAMALCLVRLALRAGEVAQLSLDDIDWRTGTLQIATSKARRASVLPLPSQVGRAIVAYLRRGRPPTQGRRIFVCHGFPVGRWIDAGVVRAAVRRGFDRAQASVPSKGTHALRHTAATRMVRAGATIKEVADVLGHRSIDTTAIYTKVDLPRLAAVALPFPKVRP
jgi:integrase/recombinase XerD